MSGEGSKPSLKLLAQDAEDISVLAAVLQDAIVPVCDMLYRPADKNFIMVVHRFRWDCAASNDGKPSGDDCCFERVCCALNVQGVAGVKMQGFRQQEQGRMLDLLTLEQEGTSLMFLFAGGAQLKLALNGWRLMVEDFGEAWPTKRQPCHAT